MENTGKVLFEDDSPRWYVAVGDGFIGPLSASDVYEKVMTQELSWAHFVNKGGQTEWARICDTPEFQVVVPQQPGRQLSKSLQAQIKQDQTQPSIGKLRRGSSVRASESDDRGWYLYYNDAQFGPFAKEEVMRFIRIGKIHGRVHAWRNGMDNWDRLENIDSFEESVAEAKKAEKKPPSFRADRTITAEVARPARPEPAKIREQRKAPRAPLVAKIVMAQSKGDQVSVGMCRDISVGGMQVLTDDVPSGVGGRIKLNVSMTGGGGSRSRKIDPFTAEGTVVRILEDGRGFSFRFEKLSEPARKAIERYIESSE